MSEPSIGHNSEEPATRFAREELKSLIERIEHLEGNKKEIASDIRDVYAEAKGKSFDVKAMRSIIRMRAEDPEKRADREAILDTYLHALGMI